MTHRPLYEIANEITAAAFYGYQEKGQWPSWWNYAQQYAQALSTMYSVDEDYYADSGKSLVAYTLSNLSQWRGEQARQIKAELRAMID